MSEKRIWELLVRQFNQEISEEELEELQLLLREQQETGPYPDLLAEMQTLVFKPSPGDKSRKKNSLSVIQKAIREQNEPEKPGQVSIDELPEADAGKKGIRRWLFIAAACIILLGTGYFLLRKNKGLSEETRQFETIVTRTGSKTLINLPDSSTVLLNSASRFGYNKTFGIDGREMELAGEAYFDIHKNAEAPLVIHAGNVIIRVLGTTFNVRANPEDNFVEATLIKGSIEVSLRTDPERRILLRPNEKIVIRRSEGLQGDKIIDSLHKNKNEVIAVTKVEPDPSDSSYIETVWTKDKMIFHKELFTSLARKMERWYNVRIVLSDAGLNDMEFTGSLEKESLQEALNALQHLARFNYRIEGKTVTVTEKY